MSRKGLSVQEALAIFEDLPSDDGSAASNDSDTDEDYVANFAQEENIISSSDDEEIEELQLPSTSKPKVDFSYVPVKGLT
ncbi:hypothetical protein X975_24913, partial [Stegodyphus mimosarum]